MPSVLVILLLLVLPVEFEDHDGLIHVMSVINDHAWAPPTSHIEHIYEYDAFNLLFNGRCPT